MVLPQAIVEMWELFKTEFRELWNAALKDKKAGDLCPAPLFGNDAPAGPDALQVCKTRSSPKCCACVAPAVQHWVLQHREPLFEGQ